MEVEEICIIGGCLEVEKWRWECDANIGYSMQQSRIPLFIYTHIRTVQVLTVNVFQEIWMDRSVSYYNDNFPQLLRILEELLGSTRIDAGFCNNYSRG